MLQWGKGVCTCRETNRAEGGQRTVPRETSYVGYFSSLHLSLGQGMVMGLFLKSPMSGKVKGDDDNV